MAKEATGEILRRRRSAAALAQRHFGSEASAGHRAAALGAAGITLGAGATGIILGAAAMGPQLATLVNAVEPGAVGLEVATAASVLANVSAYFSNVNSRAAYEWGETPLGERTPFLLERAQREARKAAEWRSAAVKVNSWVGRIFITCGVAAGTMTAGLDLTHVGDGQTIAGMTGLTEVLAATGLVGIASARTWRHLQPHHGEGGLR